MVILSNEIKNSWHTEFLDCIFFPKVSWSDFSLKQNFEDHLIPEEHDTTLPSGPKILQHSVQNHNEAFLFTCLNFIAKF